MCIRDSMKYHSKASLFAIGAMAFIAGANVNGGNSCNNATILVSDTEETDSVADSNAGFGVIDIKVLPHTSVKDQLRVTSMEAIRELRIQDIEICMLTGDGERTASSVANGRGAVPVQ